MSKASHKRTSSLSTRELNARIKRIGQACSRPVSQKELEIIFAWLDAVLLDYSFMQGILSGQLCWKLPAEEISSVEQFIETMRLDLPSRAKLRLN